jgi:phage protein D
MGQVGFRILADIVDVTNTISDRLLSLRITDESGLTSDSLEIKLDDRDYAIEWPSHGAELNVFLSANAVGFLSMGIYVVDEIEHTGPPQVLTIRAKACDMRTSLKIPKTRSWDSITIDGLVQAIAAEHGLTAKVGEDFTGISIPHLDQTNESDLHLLARLAKEHDAITKPVREFLVFVPNGTAKTFTGKTMPVIDVATNQITQHRCSQTERAKFGSVTAHWHDLESAEKQSVTVGKEQPVFSQRNTFSSEEEAVNAAKAKLVQLSRGTATLSLTMIGNPFIQAEGRILLNGMRPPLNGDWIISRAEHQIDASGYLTRCEATIPSH